MFWIHKRQYQVLFFIVLFVVIYLIWVRWRKNWFARILERESHAAIWGKKWRNISCWKWFTLQRSAHALREKHIPTLMDPMLVGLQQESPIPCQSTTGVGPSPWAARSAPLASTRTESRSMLRGRLRTITVFLPLIYLSLLVARRQLVLGYLLPGHSGH